MSQAGLRQGLAGDRSGSFFEFIRILNELAIERQLPQAVLIENVVGETALQEGFLT